MLTASKRCLIQLEKCRNFQHLKQAHGSMITSGIGDNTFALSRLLAFTSVTPLSYTQKIFQQIENPTICICNTMIKAFLSKDETEKTIHLYKFMLRNSIGLDHYTLPYLLKACTKIGESFRIGEVVHSQGLKLGFLCDDYVGNGLISMYSSFENMEAARLVFDEIPLQCVVSWTVLISGYAKKEDVFMARSVFDKAPVKDRGIWGAMISGYVQNNCFKEGLHLFRLMQVESSGIEPDEGILVSLLCACAHLGCLDIGIWIHKYTVKRDMCLSVRLGTAMIEMYARCGCLGLAEKVFDDMPQRDVVCWNVMISGLAMNGDGDRALRLFKDMERNGVRPDDITFIGMFTALSFAGMADEGLRLLWTMKNVYKIQPKIEHFGCIVELFSRAGLLEEAKNIIIHSMPVSNDSFEEAIAWRALLSASCSHGEVHLAEDAAKRVVNMDRSHSGAYVLLSNAYSAVGRHDSAKKMRKKMKNKGIEKAPGCSAVQINGVVNEFIAGEKTHPNMEEICGILEVVNKQFDSLNHQCSSD